MEYKSKLFPRITAKGFHSGGGGMRTFGKDWNFQPLDDHSTLPRIYIGTEKYIFVGVARMKYFYVAVLRNCVEDSWAVGRRGVKRVLFCARNWWLFVCVCVCEVLWISIKTFEIKFIKGGICLRCMSTDLLNGGGGVLCDIQEFVLWSYTYTSGKRRKVYFWYWPLETLLRSLRQSGLYISYVNDVVYSLGLCVIPILNWCWRIFLIMSDI